MFKLKSLISFAGLAVVALITSWASAQTWSSAKVTARAVAGPTTIYCGCPWEPTESRSGGVVLHCEGFKPDTRYQNRVDRIEWEHVVPASRLAGHLPCWKEGRKVCEKTPGVREMLFDPRNLFPSIGQMNALRSNDRMADLPDETSDYGSCGVEDAKGFFEPPADKKGDVARVYFYMANKWGLQLTADEYAMFAAWHNADPVSAEERGREARIRHLVGGDNMFVNPSLPAEERPSHQ